MGCFAPYAPEELIHACGMIPMGLWGGRTELKLVKSYLPAFACPIMQSDMELGLRGAYEGLSAVIIPAICDTLRCMTQNWRFGVTSIPMIPIVYPQNRTSPASVDYLISEYETVLTMLYTITGNMMTEKALCAAIDIYNEHNKAMRAPSPWRRGRKASGRLCGTGVTGQGPGAYGLGALCFDLEEERGAVLFGRFFQCHVCLPGPADAHVCGLFYGSAGLDERLGEEIYQQVHRQYRGTL